MSYQDFDINDLFRDCVRAEMKHGPRNESGAMSMVAQAVGVSPLTVRMRCRDLTTGRPRKKGIRERCWSFLDAIARKERAWADRLAAEIERQRDEMEAELQLRLPLEGNENGLGRDVGIVAKRLRAAERSLELADRATGDFARARRKETSLKT